MEGDKGRVEPEPGMFLANIARWNNQQPEDGVKLCEWETDAVTGIACGRRAVLNRKGQWLCENHHAIARLQGHKDKEEAYIKVDYTLFQEEPKGEAKRNPVEYRWDLLNWHFLHMMAQVAHYGVAKYDSSTTVKWDHLNYQEYKLEGDKSPINHMVEHTCKYITGQPYERFSKHRAYHLAAIAYNASMEFYHLMKEEGYGAIFGTPDETGSSEKDTGGK